MSLLKKFNMQHCIVVMGVAHIATIARTSQTDHFARKLVSYTGQPPSLLSKFSVLLRGASLVRRSCDPTGR